MTKRLDLTKEQGKEYAIGSKSEGNRKKIMGLFHKEVVKQILLGNRVILPSGITIEIIKHKHEITRSGVPVKKQPRTGFNYKVRIVYDKLKQKKVKFTESTSITKKLELILKQTNFEYKLIEHGYQ